MSADASSFSAPPCTRIPLTLLRLFLGLTMMRTDDDGGGGGDTLASTVFTVHGGQRVPSSAH